MINLGAGQRKPWGIEKEAVEAVKIMQPKVVTPCHYNSLGLFSKSYNPADVEWFKEAVEKAGFEGAVLSPGESFSPSVREKRGAQKIALQSH